ncbi:lef11 [Catopsilia pomona nucleopolyhedrovirus]|uniref:Late expression factor 11 n=1 Tax=Catopsilia pomona nucleopolyhedrovirus TaxID=1850906 RepID=A0A172WZH6_9ABAC|nr:lef11 [Catopsilia pomona nucleopolyhedrovirus]ANF29749.1 lef11 [Catopsilia pomona nucleopolyhedrovirus]
MQRSKRSMTKMNTNNRSNNKADKINSDDNNSDIVNDKITLATTATTLTCCNRTNGSNGHGDDDDYSADCLTRSELHALLRETINTMKHTMKTQNVYAHMFESALFEELKEYIRANLCRFTVITDKCSKRKVHRHHRRVARILNIEKTLCEEYKSVVLSTYKKQKW